MAFIEAPTNFYLGRVFDPQAGKLGQDVVYYDSRDLTTHAVVVGMTGSGKTGLCITMLEEAILDNIPAIIIDPKGDITNLLLGFPNLQPQDFEPWIHEEDARRANMQKGQYSADVAERWRTGLASWGIVPKRLEWMKHASQISVFTPGSDSGLPISILASLRAPKLDWMMEAESIRERITGLVTALFTLAGMNLQPVQDVEHVLLSNIIEFNWRQGRDLTLEDIILQIKQPPFEKLGVFPVDQSMNEKKRYKLAMELNNIIAAPSFQSWLNGEPLDIHNLMYQPNGRPRVSIFYTAHLNDTERMFITTLILESIIAWMRMESGTPSLRAILYIDELFGYFPPYPKNPPTKEPLMRLLKQARAFGLGLILATQNPGDLDYKGLSNAGTWFIGRLQSDQDRQRVMDGLREMATAQDSMNLAEVQQLISDIQPRVFLMRNVHNPNGALLLHTRWTMSYLAGPLTRQQISQLMYAQRQALFARLSQQTQAAHYGQQYPLQPQNYQQAAQSTNPYAPSSAAPVSTASAQAYIPTQNYGAPQMPPPPPGFGPAPSAPNYAPPPPPPGFNPSPLQQTYGQGGMNFAAQSAPMAPAQPEGKLQTARLPGGVLQAKPPVPQAIREYFLPATLTTQQAVSKYEQETGQQASAGNSNPQLAYKPVLLAHCAVRYQQKTSQVYTVREYAFHVPDLQTQGLLHWEQYQAPVISSRQIANEPFGQALYQELSIGLTDAKRIGALQKELIDFIYNTAKMIIPFHAQFKLYGDPNRPMSEFQAQVYQVARQRRDEEIDKVQIKYGTLMDKMEEKINRKQRELDAEKVEIQDRKREQLFTAGEAAWSLWKGRPNYTLSRISRATLFKRQAESDFQESREVIGEVERQMMELEQEYQQKLQEVNTRWAQMATNLQEQTLTPLKKDIHIELFGIGWLPHYYINSGGTPLMLNAFA